jgi:methionine-rich copper-binding protein CopC
MGFQTFWQHPHFSSPNFLSLPMQMKKSASSRLLSACWLLALLLLTSTAFAQGQTTDKKPEDKSKRPSPPASVTATIKGVPVTIDYGRPSAKGRPVFGKLVPYGEVWRTGANEATTFKVDKAVLINGQALPAGQYALFTIPGPDEWTIIFNKNSKQWGAYDYKSSEDVLRVKVKPTKLTQPVEQFTITADPSGSVRLAWENTQAEFTVNGPAK